MAKSFSNPGECSGELIVMVWMRRRAAFFSSLHMWHSAAGSDGQFIGLTVGEDIAFALENSCMPQDEIA